MPTFTTPEPIRISLHIGSGRVTIVASDRDDTVVRVDPGSPAADRTEISYSGGTLVVRTPEPTGLNGIFGRSVPVDMTIEVPTGSALDASTTKAEITGEGKLGECELHTATGLVRLATTGELRANTASGRLTVEHVTGRADVSGSWGSVRVGEIDGAAVVKTSSGQVWIGHAARSVAIRTANGDISVDRADSDVTAKTASGNIRAGSITRGEVELTSSSGGIDIGIAEGSAAWVDTDTKTGHVRNHLTIQDGPDGFAEKVRVNARTRSGDIVIRRAEQPTT